VIKFATLAPEGTPWMNIMEEMNREVQEKSGGQVAFRFYAGGVAGDERDVMRKIRINQLHGGAFSGFGLGEVLSEIRVLELPLLFRNGQEADHVATALFEHFTAAFAQKNFVLLALNDAGAVYVFSKDPIRTKADMARSKIWTWQGDPLPQAIFKAYGIVPVPLSLPNVLPSLQSGLIDACYGTPLTVLALQWFSKVKYRTSLSITNVMGAMLLSDALWQQLSADQQTLVREAVRKYNAKVVAQMRNYENRALTLLQTTAGIDLVYYNPNNFGVQLKDVRGDVYINNSYFGRFDLEEKVEVGKRSEFIVPAIIKLDMIGAVINQRDLWKMKEALVKIEGMASVRKGGISVNVPIKYEGMQNIERLRTLVSR
jgi:TRAP-type C4-dicarboxylate transport system substrate-binding protein